jgi:hypothetical protein
MAPAHVLVPPLVSAALFRAVILVKTKEAGRSEDRPAWPPSVLQG